MFHLTAVAAGALSTYLNYMLTAMYASDKFHLDLLNDNKHYLEAVEEGKLALRPKRTEDAAYFGYSFYIVLVLVNVVFVLLIYNRGRLQPLRRYIKRFLPVEHRTVPL